MAEPIEVLKFNLQERQYPYFIDTELQMLLDNNDSDVRKASFQGCLLKANADDGLTVGPLKTSSNREYWLGLASQYQSEYQKSISPTQSTGYYSTSMKRADEQ